MASRRNGLSTSREGTRCSTRIRSRSFSRSNRQGCRSRASEEVLTELLIARAGGCKMLGDHVRVAETGLQLARCVNGIGRRRARRIERRARSEPTLLPRRHGPLRARPVCRIAVAQRGSARPRLSSAMLAPRAVPHFQSVGLVNERARGHRQACQEINSPAITSAAVTMDAPLKSWPSK